MEVDMEKGTVSGPMTFPGIKLPNDGKISFLQLQKLQLSKQQMIDWYTAARQKVRPWATFFAANRYKVPVASNQLPRRVVLNYEYFQSNYLFVFIGLFFFCLVTSPFLLFLILMFSSLGYWAISNDRMAVVYGRRLTLPQQCSLIGLCSMPILYLAGAGAALFWVMGASFFLITTHAVFYDIQSLLEPSEEGFDMTMEHVV